MKINSIELYNVINSYDEIILSCHVNPDGDAVGSTLGLAQCLHLMGKKPVVLIDDYSEKYKFIKGREFIYEGDYDKLDSTLFICLDCGSDDRLGEACEVFKRAKQTIVIDHHVSNTEFGDYNIVFPNSSSTCEVVFETFKNFCMINYDIAVAFYTGIITDTSGFKHTSTTPRTLEVAAKLIGFGINFSEIQTRVLYTHSQNETAVFLKAVGRYKIDGKVCYSYLTKDEIINECGADYKDLDGIVEYLLNFEGMEVAVFGYEREDSSIKISMRSNSTDIGKIAVEHEGGGHKFAAGANFSSSMQEALETVVEEIKKELV